ncbi:MAG: 4-(cytidine 5'-diphospho)-2-C-methyl-D-erythritol kinase [Deltaproteobacteria bacterium]|nr:4-(cytidine 5'-diphospho)-2-C-methyl-D-erythritol kinase [Deltaproteobacteria bacterium]
MRFLSPAKVNLYLEVLKKRPDGYHEIQTLMHRVALFDEVEIGLGGRGIRLVSEGEKIPAGIRNLACRAARLFLREFGIQKDVEIGLKKRIPVAAGLGGGSSNAATVLRGLNELLRVRGDRELLMALGAKIGADVPFFIFQKPALAQGIGERLVAVEVPKPLWFLMVIPPFRISTAWAYEAYDLLGTKKKEATKIKDSYPDLKDLLPVMKNDLEGVAFSRHPQIGRMKEELLARGARGALMSGSGPVVFGLFPAKKEAERAEEAMPLPAGWRTVIARGI